ncbi:MAG: radical SAM protein [Candidatus Thiodiazotropha sp. (ex Epidulcina cf. delphinae)]|nr:radical SAM protein [Candidatus Thiodiazotropha sp. (ex Epidulcina cf. delphinae)]
MHTTRTLFFRLINWTSRTLFANRLSHAHIQAFLRNSSLRKLWNLAIVYKDIYLGREHTRSKPFVLILETTNICNLKCPFCLTGKGISGGRALRHMSFDTAKHIVDQVADSIYLLQLYTWGEPLLNKNTLSIIEYTKTKNVYVMLSTNATAMTPEYNKRLIESGIDYITVSIDGGSSESYKKYRVGGDYEKVLNNVKDLLQQRRSRKAKNPFIEWQFVVFRHNEHEVNATEKMAYQIGVDKFTPLPAYTEDESWLATDERFRPQLLNPERLKNCARPWTHLNIRADGGVASCCYEFFKKDDFGSMDETPFSETWNNRLFQQSRRIIGQERRRVPLEKSDIICYNCVKSGVRPSYVTIDADDLKLNKPG